MSRAFARIALPFFIAAVCASQSACVATAPASQPLQGELRIDVERDDDVPPGSVFFKPVSCALLGSAGDAELYRSTAQADALRIAVTDVVAGLAPHAKLAQSNASNPGELAEPREMRIARIATFFEPTSHADAGRQACANFRTRLVAPRPQSSMLVYVDRPGSIRGSRYTAPWVMQYELAFPAAGLYLIGLRAHGMVVTQRVIGQANGLTARVRRASCEPMRGRLAHARQVG